MLNECILKDRVVETPSIEAWLSSTLAKGEVVGVDPLTVSVDTAKKWKSALEACGVKLDTSSSDNLVDLVWGKERPPDASKPAFSLPLKFSGVEHSEKLASIRQCMEKEKADALVISALDEIAWVFNIRGSDVECNPVVTAYALIKQDEATLFMDEHKVTDALRAHLGGAVRLRPYGDIFSVLAAETGTVWLDTSTSNFSLLQAVESRASSLLVQKLSPIMISKAIKNSTEIEGMRNAHVRDGVALVTFFAWLDSALNTGIDKRTNAPLSFQLDEHSVSDVLERFRRVQEHFVGLSFPTIAGMGPNGAIIHYHASAESAAPVHKDGIFLCDSGAQYLDGTTDVTRTNHFGIPTAYEKHCYTRVLQGHIALAMARFPTGTSGIALDALARAPLWQSGLDYRHGTGHGVGVFLNVHEGPFGAALAARNTYTEGIKEHVTLTDEPGYYEDGKFGIRIENVLIAKRAFTPYQFGDKPYLEFEPFTVVPIGTNLVDPAMLTTAEREWLNAYNELSRTKLAPHVSGYVLDYLLRISSPI
jgi:Xaa-Pro aminopeptidase